MILHLIASYSLVITLSMPLEPNVQLERNSTYIYSGPAALQKCLNERNSVLNTSTRAGDKLSVSECTKLD